MEHANHLHTNTRRLQVHRQQALPLESIGTLVQLGVTANSRLNLALLPLVWVGPNPRGIRVASGPGFGRIALAVIAAFRSIAGQSLDEVHGVASESAKGKWGTDEPIFQGLRADFEQQPDAAHCRSRHHRPASAKQRLPPTPSAKSDHPYTYRYPQERSLSPFLTPRDSESAILIS